MEIHTYEKLWFGAALVLIVAFIATISYGAVGAGISMIDDEGGTVAPDELSEHERFGNPGVYQVNETHYEVNAIAAQFAYQPRNLEVPANSTIDFYITSRDVIHSYSIVDTNVNLKVIPGQISKVTVEFDEPMESAIICNEYCGDQHHFMETGFTVVPEEEWDDDEIPSVDEMGGDA